jgi:hypothetical protein
VQARRTTWRATGGWHREDGVEDKCDPREIGDGKLHGALHLARPR